MSKVAVVFWSGTGNTEEMAGEVLEGAKLKGAEAELFEIESFSVEKWMNLMRLHLVVRQWEMRFLKKLYLNQSSYLVSLN